MINEQVSRFFYNLRLKKIYEVVKEHLITPDLSWMIGTHRLDEAFQADLTIDEDDVNWVQTVRELFYEKYKQVNLIPQPHLILAARYALLHPGTLHRYKIERSGNEVRIIETSTIGGGDKTEDKAVAIVNDMMRNVYRKANNTDHVPDDDGVAQWWVEENKNALHNYVKTRKKEEWTPPDPQVKILAKNGDRVDLAFRRQSRGPHAGYGWNKLENIPINMAEFRRKAEAQQYTDKKHAQEIVNYKGWDDLFAKQDKQNPLQKPSLKKNKIRLANTGIEQSGQSEVFKKLYERDYEFQKRVELFIIKSTVAAVNKIKKTFSGLNIKQGDSPVSHDIRIPLDWHSIRVNAETINDVMQEIRLRFFNTTSEIEDEKWTNWRETFIHDAPVSHWAFQKIASIAISSVSKNLGLKFKGGPGSVYARGTGGEAGEEGQEDLGDVAGKQKYAAPEPEDEEMTQTRQSMIMNALRDPENLKNPQILQAIKKLAEEDPRIMDILKKMNIDLDQPHQSHENYKPYSFRKYLAMRG